MGLEGDIGRLFSPTVLRKNDKMDTYVILIHGEKIIVEGIYSGKYFGIRPEDGGWRITHIPTGYLLTCAHFASLEDAQELARGVEKVYGDDLQEINRGALLHAATKTPRGEKVYKLIRLLDEEKKPVTIKKLRSLANALA